MPFALLMTETLRRREARDRERGYPEEYIKARDSREIWYVLNYVLALLAIVAVNFWPVGIPFVLRALITVAASVIFVLSVYKFFKSVLS